MVQTVAGTTGADYIYYNADIINNETNDRAGGKNVIDPQIRFNETRDAPLIKDASQYYFSIVRFSMNGAGKDLPLFIPVIQTGTGNSTLQIPDAAVNLTTYSAAISLQQTWNIPVGAGVASKTFNIAPQSRFVIYEPETKNPEVAPQPRSMANPGYRGIYNVSSIYRVGDVVATGFATAPLPAIGVGPFYQTVQPPQWNANDSYRKGTAVSYNGLVFSAIATIPPGSPPPVVGVNWVLGIVGVPTSNTQVWASIAGDQGNNQDLSTRYYWVYTYQHWLDLVNKTILDPAQLSSAPGAASTCIYQDLYNEFELAWYAAGANAGSFPYATLQAFVDVVNAPQIVYSPDTKRFTIYADSDGFGSRITTFTPAGAGVVGPTTSPYMRLFFNTNMFGLFSNFNNTYWNTVDPTIGPFAGLPIWVDAAANGAGTLTPIGYTNEILFKNKFWTNVVDYRLPPQSGVPPLGYVPTAQQKPYWTTEQDYYSVDSLWSPISSIVFTSTLLPIRSEFTGQPVSLGSGNIGNSSATVQSAFQPIITDITLDQAGGASDYRGFISYVPTAEYRLSDFTGSKQDVRNIDVQVSWKNRLDNLLYPINMFNCSNVSFKMMFRHKDAL